MGPGSSPLFFLIPCLSYSILPLLKRKWFSNLPNKMSDHFYIQDDASNGPSPSGPDNRRHVRFPVCLTVEYSQESPVEFKSFILNVSARGCYLQTENPFSVGSDIIIRLSIPPQIKVLVTLTGKVAWVNKGEAPLPPGMGIKFDETNQNALRQLMAYLEGEAPLVDRKV
jgi:uncharacterized protein (TIGR02266 family)